MGKQIASYVKVHKRGILAEAEKGTYGGLSTLLEAYAYPNVKTHADFDDNTMFSVDSKYMDHCLDQLFTGDTSGVTVPVIDLPSKQVRYCALSS